MKRQEPTITSVVMAALIARDDFMSLDALVEATGLDRHSIQGTLLYLRKNKAIDSVESGGHLYWYPTPDSDQRSRKVEERKPEAKPRAFKGRAKTPRAKPLKY